MTLPIVQINVSVSNPGTPSALLRTGAFVSQGGTNTAAGTLSLLTGITSLASLLAGSQAIASLAWSSGVVTGTVTGGHSYTVTTGGETVSITIAGVTPAGYNGTFGATITSSTQFTYPLASNPGAATVTSAVVTDGDVAELNAMNATYFAQGFSNSVYVLELGASQPSIGVSALQTYINTNPNTEFAFLVPREWDGEATFKTMCNAYTAPSQMVYFFVTTTISTYAAWVTGAYKSVLAAVEAPGIPATEFSLAAAFYTVLNNNPGSATQVSQLCFTFAYGVTPYPSFGNGTILQQLKTANVGYISTGAEGGLTNTMIVWGNTMDGKQFNYWYTVAWAIINIDQNLANEVINGSNNGLAPLYYNQFGITRLQNRAAKVLRNGVSYGLVLGNVIQTQLNPIQFGINVANGVYAGNAVINAAPFDIYTNQNPNDYALGKYAGLQCAITPQLGFQSIIFNLNVTLFV